MFSINCVSSGTKKKIMHRNKCGVREAFIMSVNCLSIAFNYFAFTKVLFKKKRTNGMCKYIPCDVWCMNVPMK